MPCSNWLYVIIQATRLSWEGAKIGKRIAVILVGLAVLSVGVGLATYKFLTGSLSGGTPTRTDDRPEYLYSITGVGKDVLKSPLSTASGGDTVFATDSFNKKVAVFDLNGTAITSFKPVPEVQSAYPIMVAVDDRQRFYVTVAVGSVNKIMVYDRRGNSLYAFPDGVMKGFGAPPSLNKPVGLFIGGDRVYVTDIGDHDVKIFDIKNGALLNRFGGRGREPGKFSYPNGVAVTRSGKIYVSDSNNARVQVFDESGKYVTSLVSAGGQRLFSLPRGVAVDPLGRVHVVDVFAHKVLVFDSSNDELLFTYGQQGNAVDEFYYPNGIAIDPDGKIFIADRQNNRLAIWQVK